MIRNKVFLKAAVTGLLVIAVSVWMIIVGKVDTTGIWLPDGFNTPILAMEFASSKRELSKIIGSIDTAISNRIIAGTQVDMLFLVVYNLFLFFILRAIYKITRLEQFKWLALLPFVVMVADAIENYQLLMAISNFKYSLLLLQIATWVKWLGLALVFTAIGRFLITTGRYYDKVLALSTYVTLPLGIWAFFAHSGINEVFAMLFYLLFPLTIVFTWFPGIQKKS